MRYRAQQVSISGTRTSSINIIVYLWSSEVLCTDYLMSSCSGERQRIVGITLSQRKGENRYSCFTRYIAYVVRNCWHFVVAPNNLSTINTRALDSTGRPTVELWDKARRARVCTLYIEHFICRQTCSFVIHARDDSFTLGRRKATPLSSQSLMRTRPGTKMSRASCSWTSSSAPIHPAGLRCGVCSSVIFCK